MSNTLTFCALFFVHFFWKLFLAGYFWWNKWISMLIPVWWLFLSIALFPRKFFSKSLGTTSSNNTHCRDCFLMNLKYSLLYEKEQVSHSFWVVTIQKDLIYFLLLSLFDENTLYNCKILLTFLSKFLFNINVLVLEYKKS